MRAGLNAFWTAMVFLLVVVLLVQRSTREMRQLAKHYPKRPTEAVNDCGLYLFGGGWYRLNVVRIGVSSGGLSLKQPLIPWVHSVEAFVPWPETMMRETGDYVRLGFETAPELEIRIKKVVIATMQHKLKSRVPFGHVA